MSEKLKTILHETDICVVGGGIGGMMTAISAARHGAKVVLMQDRPVLGGNCSSEIRMWISGAGTRVRDLQETGLMEELLLENMHRNPRRNFTTWDALLYEKVKFEENIELLLNCSCCDAETVDGHIESIKGFQLTTYTWHQVKAKIFVDSSGDSILAPLTGAEYKVGREAKAEFNEEFGLEQADPHTMGMSLMIQCRETDHPISYTPPAWAYDFPDDDAMNNKPHNLYAMNTNFYWVELGGMQDSIADTEEVRDELLKIAFGAWDHIKNHGDHGAENWDLEWVGFLPGKRETRRYVGDYVVTEHDILAGGHFEDEVAYGGWPLDDHNPYGMRQTGESNVPSIMIPVEEPYGLPLRALYSRNVENLFFAGRNISVTHAALSSTRVMGTCSVLGQAMGTAAGTAVKYHCSPRRVWEEHTKEVQKILLDAGAFLPHIKRDIHPLMLEASMNVEEQVRLSLLNGWDRPRQEGEEKGLLQTPGDALELSWDAPREIPVLRLKFDPDYSRFSVSDNAKMRVFAQKLHTGFDFAPVRPAGTVAKGFVVYADGEEIFRTEKNEQSFVKIPLHVQAQKLRILWTASYGKKVGLHSVDFLDE